MTATEVAMPNKTIYVSDDDMPLYQRAQQLAGGNLSSAIAQALRRFVDAMEAREQGLQEITVWVGRGTAARRKRFQGRTLGRWVHQTGKSDEVFTVYGTAKDRLALHVQRGGPPDWGGWPVAPHGTNWWEYARAALAAHRPPAPPAPPGPPPPPAPPGGFGRHAPPPWSPPAGPHQHWAQPGAPGWGPRSEATFEVFDSLDEMREHIPPELAEMLERPVEPEIEDLDI